MITRRQQKEHFICANGLNVLPREIWMTVFSHLNSQELAKSVMPVCKLWQRMGQETSKEQLMVPVALGKEIKGRREEESLIISLLKFISKREGTLRAVCLKLHVGKTGFQRIFSAASKCRQLVVLEIFTNGYFIRLIKLDLPPTLKILRTNCAWESLQADPDQLQVLEHGGNCYGRTAQLSSEQNDLRAVITSYLSDFFLKDPARLTKVQYLELSGCTLVKEVATVAMRIPSLRILVLRCASLLDTGFECLGSHPKLEKLHIETGNSCTLGRQALLQLLQVPSLHFLILRSMHSMATLDILTQILQAALRDTSLEACRLKHLQIWNNSDSCRLTLPSFHAIPSLRSLKIRGTMLDIIPFDTRPASEQSAILLQSDHGFNSVSQDILSALDFQFEAWVDMGRKGKFPSKARLGSSSTDRLQFRRLGLEDAFADLDTDCKDYKPYLDFLEHLAA